MLLFFGGIINYSMIQNSNGEENSTSKKRSRRRFLTLAGTASTVGIAGCLGALEDESKLEPTVDSTLCATWRGSDPTSSITLQWLTANQQPPNPVTVRLSPAEGDGSDSPVHTEVAPFDDDQLYRHRAESTDLSPNTRYLIDINGSETTPAIKTAPRTLTETITFTEGGDLGTSSAVARLHDQAAEWEPLFGLVGGDLAYANGTSQRKWVTFLETWHQHMRAGDRLIPLVAAIGNHEVQSDLFEGGLHESPDEAPFFYTLFDNTRRDHAYWALDFGKYLSVIILDSNHTTPVPGIQTKWLKEALAERRDRTHLIATYHVPAYPSSKPIDAKDRSDIREQWAPLFERYDVDVAFEHDDHSYKRTHPLRDGEPVSKNGVRYIGDGTWGQEPRDAKSSKERPYLQKTASRRHVIRVTMTPDERQRFQTVDPNGETIDQFDL